MALSKINPALINTPAKVIPSCPYPLPPIFVAAIFGQREALKWLKDNGADLYAKVKIESKATTVAKAKAKAYANDRGYNLLQFTVRYAQDPDMVGEVLNLYSALNRMKLITANLLGLAAESHHTGMLNTVIRLFPENEQKQHFILPQPGGKTIFMHAILSKNLGMPAAVLNLCTTPRTKAIQLYTKDDKTQSSPIRFAAKSGSWEMFMQVLNLYPPAEHLDLLLKDRDKNDQTLLIAVGRKKEILLRMASLVKDPKKLDEWVKAIDKEGFTLADFTDPASFTMISRCCVNGPISTSSEGIRNEDAIARLEKQFKAMKISCDQIDGLPEKMSFSRTHIKSKVPKQHKVAVELPPEKFIRLKLGKK